MYSSNERILSELTKRFVQYKLLGEKTLEQLDESNILYRPNEFCNSISIIIQHLHGNMKSRFTQFLTTDGEKEWRNRDLEFKFNTYNSKEIQDLWAEGWNILITTLASLQPEDLDKIVYIRKEPLTVTDALFRQLAHYSYHMGQIVQIGKSLKSEGFKSLSIPLGQSKNYNHSMGIKDPSNLYPPKK